MQNVTFKSLLLENKQGNRAISYKNDSPKPQGIDFKNDSVLISAKQDWTNAQSTENSKENLLSYQNIYLDRISNELTQLWSKYQEQNSLLQQAQLKTDNFSKTEESVMEKLTAQNNTIANLDQNKTNLNKDLANKDNQMKIYKNQKAAEVNTHDSKIQNLTNAKNQTSKELSNTDSQINQANTRLNSVNNSISNINSQISELNSTLANATENEKASLTSQISNLQQQLSAKKQEKTQIENNLKTLNERKTALAKEIKNYETKISAEEQAKQKTINSYDNLITNLQAKIDTTTNNLNNVTNTLTEAVYVQTRLSLEQACLKAKIKESKVFEQSVLAMLLQTNQKIEVKENQKAKTTEKTDNATKEYETAKTTTTEKENVYTTTEKELKSKYKEENKQFVA